MSIFIEKYQVGKICESCGQRFYIGDIMEGKIPGHTVYKDGTVGPCEGSGSEGKPIFQGIPNPRTRGGWIGRREFKNKL